MSLIQVDKIEMCNVVRGSDSGEQLCYSFRHNRSKFISHNCGCRRIPNAPPKLLSAELSSAIQGDSVIC